MTAETLDGVPARQALFPAGALTERLIAEQQGAVGWLSFNNAARRNAISIDMWEAIPQVLEAFARDPDIRVVVLRGCGDKAFVSGADVSQYERERSSAAGVQRYEEIAEAAQERLNDYDKPTIAMIRGYCLGAGINIALSCDVRLAADDAKLGVPAAKIGLGYRLSSTKNLVDTIGHAYAREMLITARQFAAEEARAMGLVHRVVPAAALDALVADYCGMLSANAPLTMRNSKRIIGRILRAGDASPDADGHVAACAALVKECFDSQDYIEGRRAFMAKRKPVFQGK